MYQQPLASGYGKQMSSVPNENNQTKRKAAISESSDRDDSNVHEYKGGKALRAVARLFEVDVWRRRRRRV